MATVKTTRSQTGRSQKPRGLSDGPRPAVTRTVKVQPTRFKPSARGLIVMDLIASGKNNSEILQAVPVALSTISKLRKRLNRPSMLSPARQQPAQAALLVMAGRMSAIEAGAAYGIDPATVHRWVNRLKAEDLQAWSQAANTLTKARNPQAAAARAVERVRRGQLQVQR